MTARERNKKEALIMSKLEDIWTEFEELEEEDEEKYSELKDNIREVIDKM